MGQRGIRVGFIALIAAATAACASGAPSPVPSPSTVAAATSFDEYAVGFCSAFEAMFRAVGNPDTAEGSERARRLIRRSPPTTAIPPPGSVPRSRSILETGRQHVVFARGWQPAAPTMVQLDRVLVAFEAMTAAKVAAANQAPNAVNPQVAFEASGGLDAWTAMFEAYAAIGSARPTAVPPCAAVPVVAP